jgi:hypothetical protein
MSTLPAANAASAPLRSLLSRLTIKGPERGPEAVLSVACSELRACAQPSPQAGGADSSSSSPTPPLPSCSSSPLREALDEIRALRLRGAAGGKEDVALAHAIERRRAILRGEFFAFRLRSDESYRKGERERAPSPTGL